MPISPGILDFELAWRRAVSDLVERRAFVRHPYLDTVLSGDLTSYLNRLARSVGSGGFRAHACRIVPVPKPHGHIRPGADLHLADQIVFAALVEQMRPQITAALGPNSGSPDYSYHLRSNRNHTDWFEPFFARWQAFDRDSVLAIDQGAQYVVVADVAGCYENIDLSTLRSDLNALAVNSDVLTLLMDCLHRWPRIQRRGIPQGHSPSDLLAKLYLRSVDLELVAQGFSHKRWVDDFRIFCGTEQEARRALVVLADALGRRGLVLQTAKSRILSAAEARIRFNEVHTLLDPVQGDVARELAQNEGHSPSYLPPWILDRVLAQAGRDGAVQIIRSAFHRYFVEPGFHFNKSLFHYLLSRLGAANDATHVEHIVRLLSEHPEEFDDIAKYCSAIDQRAVLEEHFLDLQETGILPYPYILYQFLRWRLQEDRALSGRTRLLIRDCAFGSGNPWYVRAIARALLGKLGDTADLESLEAAYADADSHVERAELVCAMQRVETGRRNAFFGRASGDGDLVSRAVRLSRAGTIGPAAC